MLLVTAPAKLNLTLELLGKRPDGYHEIRSVMQTVSLMDTLEIEEAEAIELLCDDPRLANAENLVYRAARLLAARAGNGRGARVTLRKAIPTAAGLGGGSSDAAATLRGLNQFWKLGLDVTELRELAATLGSDVPFFVSGGTALVEGRGEIVHRLDFLGEYWFLIVVPEVSIPDKTATLYKQLTPSDFTEGQHSRELVAALRQGLLLNQALLYNGFTRPVLKVMQGVLRVTELLQSFGVTDMQLAGSGPAVYVLLNNRHQGEQWAVELATKLSAVYVVKSVPSVEELG